MRIQLNLFLIFVVLGLASGANAAGYYGEVSDPKGDVNSFYGNICDLAFSSITVEGNNIKFTTLFHEGSFDQDNVAFAFSLDTDQDPETGHPGVDAGGVLDAQILGTDYIAFYDPRYTYIEIMKSSGTPNQFFNVAVSSQIVFESDGLEFVLPLAWFGNDDGLMNFKVTAWKRQPGTNGFTGVLDYMSDGGLPAAATTAVPIPGSIWGLALGLCLLGMWAKSRHRRNP